MYIEALKNSGFKEEFTYLEPKMPNNIINNNKLDMNKENTNCNNKLNCRKNRKRKIIGLNSTFCKLVNINIGKYFFQLIDKNFNQYNILHKIFNRKTVKISYFCTRNFFKIINTHINEITRKYYCYIIAEGFFLYYQFSFWISYLSV